MKRYVYVRDTKVRFIFGSLKRFAGCIFLWGEIVQGIFRSSLLRWLLRSSPGRSSPKARKTPCTIIQKNKNFCSWEGRLPMELHDWSRFRSDEEYGYFSV